MCGRGGALVLLGFAGSASAIDNGLGLTPPMGWRSWNLYGARVDQKLIQVIMDGMVSKKRTVDGVPTSLCDLGYCDVGLDDNWQDCKGGNDGFNYHQLSNGSFKPLVNSAFPDMAAMTAHAHSLGLSAGWYGNNCICSEKNKWVEEAVYQGDVDALTRFGFDAIKLDGCGVQLDLDLWARLINQTGRRVMIENCHWGNTVPTETWCPWNFFRTSGDVRASYGSVVGNLQTTVKWAQLARPGCWAYPDMLEVGCQVTPFPGDKGLTPAETRAHFGAWCIVSSPLTLSHDVNNDTIMDTIWPVISNKEAIAINQAWAGHAGSPFKQSEEVVMLEDYNHVMQGSVTPHQGDPPAWQYFYKPVGGGKVAVLLMNHNATTLPMKLDFADVPGLTCSDCEVRDVWEHKDLGLHSGSISTDVESHDAAFYVISPSKSAAAIIL